MRDGSAEPVSRDQILRRGRGQGKTMTTRRIGNHVCMYGHTDSKIMDQPGRVANPARGQLNRENDFFPVPVRA